MTLKTKFVTIMADLQSDFLLQVTRLIALQRVRHHLLVVVFDSHFQKGLLWQGQ